MVAYMKNKTQQSSHRIFDLKAGEQAFKELEATLRAIPAQDIAIPNCDVQNAAVSALALVDVANAPASKERFDWLADEIFKKDAVERLERVAWAAWYAHVRMRSEAAVETETKVDPATFEAAGSLLTKMLKLIDYHVGDRTEVAAEIDDIRSGSGYQDRASDLVRAAALWERWRGSWIRIHDSSIQKTGSRREPMLGRSCARCVLPTGPIRRRGTISGRGPGPC